MDLGGNRRGVDMGPSAFRLAGIEAGIRELGLDFVDRGDIPVKLPQAGAPLKPTAKNLPEIAEACGMLSDAVRQAMD